MDLLDGRSRTGLFPARLGGLSGRQIGKGEMTSGWRRVAVWVPTNEGREVLFGIFPAFVVRQVLQGMQQLEIGWVRLQPGAEGLINVGEWLSEHAD